MTTMTKEDHNARSMRLRVAELAAGMPPVTDVVSQLALNALTAWTRRPGPRNSADLAWYLAWLIEENERRERLLTAAVRLAVETIDDPAGPREAEVIAADFPKAS